MKKILIIILSIGLLAGLILYTSASFENRPKTNFHISLSNSVFLGVDGLQSTVIGYKSSVDIHDFQLVSNCDSESKFLGNTQDIYFYYISYKSDCKNNVIVLQKNGVNIYNSLYKLKFFDAFEIYNKFTDYSTTSLEEVLVDLSKKQRTLKKYKDSKNLDPSNFLSIQKKRKYDEVSYIHGIISTILESREYPYLIPVLGYQLPTRHTHMPNSSRGYRAEYTDGVHHGWDIFAPNKTPVIALDSGIIIKVVSDFGEEDFLRITRGDNLTSIQELVNLDILRGKQVWLKTMKGEVVFYSHLESVSEDIQVGDFVTKGAILGKTGVSGVPVADYTDYHLHFAIQKNPYNSAKAGKYSLQDYMAWDWLLKGLNIDEVREKQSDIFVK